MSRLWSRFGVRTLSVALLSVGVVGGYYLADNQETRQQALKADVAVANEQAELAFMHQRHAAHELAVAQKRVAEQEAAKQAAEAAKAEAERARKAAAAAADRKAREKAKSAETGAYDGPIPASCNEYSGNRKTGCAILLQKGFGIDQMPCLEKLWTKESGWNHKAENSGSGAYGIPQALPGSKMGTVADDWKTNPATQITWGIGYIKGRYDTPCGAWSYFQANGHY
ncbi:lytic transglycosylase domain-containing protein [Micromonospora zhanjiangensis]